MKRIIITSLICALCASMTGCNENLGFGSYTFRHARISDGTIGQCVTVNSWHDNDLGCEIHTPNGTIYCSEGTYQLFENQTCCPYC